MTRWTSTIFETEPVTESETELLMHGVGLGLGLGHGLKEGLKKKEGGGFLHPFPNQKERT